MSFLDRIAAAIMPAETPADRAHARRTAQSLAGDGDWLAIVLEHHRQIEIEFSRALTAPDGTGRRAALQRLQVVLTGHANAEEAVLYPALVECGEQGHATMAYEEQAMAKVELARIERLDPMGRDWREKLEHVQGAVMHHVYAEEGTWFPELQQRLPASEGQRLTQRFLAEFERYTHGATAEIPLQQAAQQFGSDAAPSVGDY